MAKWCSSELLPELGNRDEREVGNTIFRVRFQLRTTQDISDDQDNAGPPHFPLVLSPQAEFL
jgi:hypothetical protein